MSPDLVALHMGALHPVEKVLTLLLAFGPFVVLGAVIAVRRRHEPEDERRLADADPAAGLDDEGLAQLVDADVEDAQRVAQPAGVRPTSHISG